MRKLVLPALYLLQRKIQICAQHIIVYVLILLHHVGFICCFGYDLSDGRDTDFFLGCVYVMDKASIKVKFWFMCGHKLSPHFSKYQGKLFLDCTVNLC